LTPSSARILKLSAAALAVPALCLAAILAVRGIALSALRKIDPEASFRSLSVAPGAILLEDVLLPALGFRAPEVWALSNGPLFDPLRWRVMVPSCTLADPHYERRGHGGSGGGGSIPDLFVDRAVLMTGNDTSLVTGWISGNGPDFCGLASGEWGSMSVSGSSRNGRILVQAVFDGCSGMPGGFFSFPSSLSGHLFSGKISGSLAGDSAILEGMLDSLDGEPAGIPFSLAGCWGGAMGLEAQTDLSTVEPVLSGWLQQLDPGAFISLHPEGSARLSFAEGSACTYAVDARLDSALIFSPLLAADTIRFSASALASGELGSDLFTIDSGSISLGEMEFGIGLEATENGVRLHAWNPSIRGEAITSSIPSAMQGRLRGTTLSGHLGVDLLLFIDRACPESSDVSIAVDASDLSVGWCPAGVSRFRSGGICVMHDTWGNARTIDLDPLQNEAFVRLDSMPPFFEALLCCAEDGEFRRHSGFSPDHIRSSLIANLSNGRFVRGASTLTMQLARNLFLSREKTLSRKLQEVFLTWMLERTLTKDRILEIYANIVELGPDVFGFPEAAGYYFGSRMQDLSVRQVAYLISLLPGPHSYHRFFERGEVPAWEEDYLDILVRGAGNRGALTSEDEERALGERISFPGRPGT
jgi:hypothetical protein